MIKVSLLALAGFNKIRRNHKNAGLAGLVAMGLLAGGAARADALANIQTWVGTGTNEAGLEIDWENGSANSALVWGYRWDGTATGEQMFDAIVAGDPRLYAEISAPTAYGTAVFGLGFHASGDQNFLLSPALSFNSQHLAYTDFNGVDDSRTAVAAGDFWQEGWYTAGYWSYFNSTDSRLSADWSDWDDGFDMTTRVLDNGDFDAQVFDYDFAYPGPNPAVPLDVAPAPEPGTWALLALSGILFAGCRRNRA
jgi:hypothetical protein